VDDLSSPAGIAAIACLIGLLQAVAGWAALRHFRRRAWLATAQPPMSVLKPLHGDEPLLEDALASLCALDYPDLQIVCGVQNLADPALATVARVQARFPGRDIAVIVDATRHGANGKVGNLINMLPAAKHDLLVIADSDVHVLPGYLEALAATLAEPGVGLATVLYTGRQASPTLAAKLGAAWIDHVFLPGALLGRALGRQDCLGATMALRRETLDALGGFAVLANDLADDQMLGRRVRALGLSVRLAPSVVATTVAETTIGALQRHELRWGRTIRALEPVGFALSALQHPLAWGLLAVGLASAAPWSIAAFLAAWVMRSVCARGIEGELAAIHETLATRQPIWLFPLRDIMSMTVLVASHAGRRVEWRGHVMQSTPPPVGSHLR
jgi:ceramide glucosyltransferase